MSKQEFLSEISRRLNGLPQEEIEKSVAYFREMIDDRIEDGMSEEEAVSDIGDVDSAVTEILQNVPLTKVIKSSVKPQRKIRTWEIVFLILGSPIWIPLLLLAICLIFLFYILIWAVVIVFFVCNFAFFVSGMGAVAAGIISFAELGTGLPLLAISGGLFLIGASVLLFIPLLKLAKGTGKLGKKIVLWIKSWFIRRKKNA